MRLSYLIAFASLVASAEAFLYLEAFANFGTKQCQETLTHLIKDPSLSKFFVTSNELGKYVFDQSYDNWPLLKEQVQGLCATKPHTQTYVTATVKKVVDDCAPFETPRRILLATGNMYTLLVEIYCHLDPDGEFSVVNMAKTAPTDRKAAFCNNNAKRNVETLFNYITEHQLEIYTVDYISKMTTELTDLCGKEFFTGIASAKKYLVDNEADRVYPGFTISLFLASYMIWM